MLITELTRAQRFFHPLADRSTISYRQPDEETVECGRLKLTGKRGRYANRR